MIEENCKSSSQRNGLLTKRIKPEANPNKVRKRMQVKMSSPTTKNFMYISSSTVRLVASSASGIDTTHIPSLVVTSSRVHIPMPKVDFEEDSSSDTTFSGSNPTFTFMNTQSSVESNERTKAATRNTATAHLLYRKRKSDMFKTTLGCAGPVGPS